jgi:hypothetical protein
MSAVMGNRENVMITNNTEEVVSKFVQEFEKLWTEFAP